MLQARRLSQVYTGQQQSGVGLSALFGVKMMQDREAGAVRTQTEQRASPIFAAETGSSIEYFVIDAQAALGRTALQGILKMVQSAVLGAVGFEAEHGAVFVLAAQIGGAVEYAVAAFYQIAVRMPALGHVEMVQHLKALAGAFYGKGGAYVVLASAMGNAEEFAVAVFEYAAVGVGAVLPSKMVKNGQIASVAGNAEHGTHTVQAPLGGHAVEGAVLASYQGAFGPSAV